MELMAWKGKWFATVETSYFCRRLKIQKLSDLVVVLNIGRDTRREVLSSTSVITGCCF